MEVYYMCFDRYHIGVLRGTQLVDDLVFHFKDGGSIKIGKLDHVSAFVESRINFSDKIKRTAVKLVTKRLESFDFCFLSKWDSESFLRDIQAKISLECRSVVLRSPTTYLENADFADIAPNSVWRLSNANQAYTLCSSLPENVVVVKGTSDQSIIRSANSHTDGRFPTINYIYAPNQSCLMSASSILIYSQTDQPVRCQEDEKMLATLAANLMIQDKDVIVLQVTTIPHTTLTTARNSNNREKNLIAQGATGANLLNNWLLWTNYTTLSMNVIPVNNLSLCLGQVLSSLGKLPSKYYPPSAAAGITTKNSAVLWLNNIHVCVNQALSLVNKITTTKTLVLIMDEFGVDYSLVLISLCQILLDPDCRTVKGFLRMLYRDWITGGHPFDERNIRILNEAPIPSSLLGGCHSSSSSSTNSSLCSAPIFFFFLNCVKTIHQNFYRCFEFNENLLLRLFEDSYEYIIGNCDKARKERSIHVDNLPIWSHFDDFDEMVNRIYLEYPRPIVGRIAMHKMELWDSVFLVPLCHPKNKSFSQIYLEKVNDLANNQLNELSTNIDVAKQH